MDDAERKRIADVAKKRAATALTTAQKVSPSGPVPDARAAAKARAKEALSGGSMQNTSVEAPPGFFKETTNAIGRFLTGAGFGLPSEGDIDPKLKSLGSYESGGLAMAPLNALTGVMDTIQNRDERTGDITPVNTALNAGVDTLSIGAANKVRGILDTLTEESVSEDGFGTAMAENIDERALEQEEIRAANPGVALSADVAASVATGTVMGKGLFDLTAKVAPKVASNIGRNWTARILFGSVAGAGEAGAYRLTKDGDLARAAQDASVAMLGGIAIGGLLQTGKGLTSIIRNVKAPDVVEEGVGSELIRMINIERQTQGLPVAKASDIVAEVQKLGPDATLMDAYPTLKQFATHVLRNEDSAMAGDGLRAVISTRADLLEELMAPEGTLKTAFGAKAVRAYKQFSQDVGTRFDRLQPRYNEIYKQYENTRFAGKQIMDNINTLFGEKTRRSAAQQDLVDAVQAQIKSYTAQGKKVQATTAAGKPKFTVDPATGAKKKVMTYPDELTLEQATDLKRVIQRAAGEKTLRIAGTDRVVPLDNIALRDLSQVQGFLSDFVHNQVPELIPLDKVYGNVASLKTAYKAGVDAFKPSGDSADVTAFLFDGNKSAASKRAFIEGAKYRVFKMLNGAKTADGIERIIFENRETFAKMEGLLGKEGVDAMMKEVVPQVTKLKTAEDLRKAIPRVERPEPKSQTVGESLDVATAIGGVPGVVSKAGAIGALRRLMGQATDPAEATKRREMYGSILSQMGEGASDAYKSLESLLQRPIRPSDMGSIQNAAGLGVSTTKAVNEGGERDGQLPR